MGYMLHDLGVLSVHFSVVTLDRSKGPCDVFDPWVRGERGQVGIWNLSGGAAAGAGVGGVWKSGNVCWHQNWSEMGPYGSIWLDTAAKMIVRTSRILFVFKKS